MKGKFTVRKWQDNDRFAWAVFKSTDIPKGHKGVVPDEMATPIVCNCSRKEADASRRLLLSGKPVIGWVPNKRMQ